MTVAADLLARAPFSAELESLKKCQKAPLCSPRMDSAFGKSRYGDGSGTENGNDHGLELKADHGPPQLSEHSA